MMMMMVVMLMTMTMMMMTMTMTMTMMMMITMMMMLVIDDEDDGDDDVDDDDDDDDDEPPTLASADENARRSVVDTNWFRFSGTILGGQAGYGNLRPLFGNQFWYPYVGRFFSFFSGMFLVRAVAVQGTDARQEAAL